MLASLDLSSLKCPREPGVLWESMMKIWETKHLYQSKGRQLTWVNAAFLGRNWGSLTAFSSFPYHPARSDHGRLGSCARSDPRLGSRSNEILRQGSSNGREDQSLCWRSTTGSQDGQLLGIFSSSIKRDEQTSSPRFCEDVHQPWGSSSAAESTQRISSQWILWSYLFKISWSFYISRFMDHENAEHGGSRFEDWWNIFSSQSSNFPKVLYATLPLSRRFSPARSLDSRDRQRGWRD